MMNGDVRLFDFGHSTFVGQRKQLRTQSIPFAAPEIVLKTPTGLASDWWSYGVVAAILFNAKQPFNTTASEVEQQNGYGTPDLGGLDKIKKEFVMKFLKNDPTKRLAIPSTDDFFENLDFAKQFKPPKIEPVENEADEVPDETTEKIHNALQKEVRIPSEDYIETLKSSL